mmetsp:Transcript_19840/g.55957  ORF Transcript_19840/g.55957 Transcript_19840/m.55957 type:complete len:164 (-) Transcript_19840:134-625(-)
MGRPRQGSAPWPTEPHFLILAVRCLVGASLELAPGERDAVPTSLVLLQTDSVVSKASAPAQPAPLAVAARGRALALPAFAEDVRGGGQSTGQISMEALITLMQVRGRHWIVWPIMLLLLVLACGFWLYCAISAQTGRCDNPAFANAEAAGETKVEKLSMKEKK